MKKLTTEEFIERCKKIHKGKYSYDLVEYKGSHNKVILICKKHGKFKITAYNHLNLKQGCFKCGMHKTHSSNRISVIDFLKKCEKIKEYDFDVDKLNFKNLRQEIKITCKKHGDFLISPRNLLRNCGCRKCKTEKRRDSKEDFVKKSLNIHNHKYDYNNVLYNTSHDKIEIICKKHGPFWQKPYQHTQGQGCAKCSHFTSREELEVKDFIESLNIKTIGNHRKEKGVFEIDIFIPLLNIGIEYHGLYWHSEKFKDKKYHQNKYINCKSQGIKLLQVFDDEWKNKKEICKSRIKNILGFSEKKIYARNTDIRTISSRESRDFLNKNHIQGFIGSKYYFGLFYKNELVALMSFSKNRKNLGRKSIDGYYELTRFCNKIGHIVVGGASKLLNHFVKNYYPKKIISYADLRWSNGNIYEKLGFNFVKNTNPNYFYTKDFKNRENRFKYRKDILVESGFNKNKTEAEIMKERGFSKIYDAGHALYERYFNV